MKRDLLSWLGYINKIHPKNIEYTVEKTKQFAQSLDLLSLNCQVIIVGGTNGKGTICALLEKVLTDNGFVVGMFTSPHLLNVTERVRLMAKNVDERILINAFEFIDMQRGEIKLTYFEFLTLSALYIFKQAFLDFAILEIGLGGRLDTVNIINSDVSIISSIAIDHVEYLGHDRESIGFEKAGIYKNGCHAICGDCLIPNSVQEHVQSHGIELAEITKHFGIQTDLNRTQWWSGDDQIDDLKLPSIEPSNLACVLECIKQLKLTKILQTDIINQSLQTFNLLGRFSIFQDGFMIILDIAHNPQAMSSLANKLVKLTCGKKIAIFSMSKEKDILKSVEQLRTYFDYWYVLMLDDLHAATSNQYQQAFSSLKMDNYSFIDCLSGLLSSLKVQLLPDAQVVIFGSFRLVAKFLTISEHEKTIISG